MQTQPSNRLIIRRWSAVSPYGIGAQAFIDGLREGAATERPLMYDEGPYRSAHLVPDFSPALALGKKGTRSMDRATALAVTTVRELLDGLPESLVGDRPGLVLGTTTGSASSMMEFTRDSLTGQRPFFVDPARFPNTVMNCAAGQCAIWHNLTGPNATVAGGRLSAFHALNYAKRLIRTRRASSIIAAAVEEYSTARAWLEAVQGQSRLLGEGCGALLVTDDTRTDSDLDDVEVEVLSVQLGVSLDSSKAALTRLIHRTLEQAGLTAADVDAVSFTDTDNESQVAAAAAVLGTDFTVVPPVEAGDCGAAAGALGLVATVNHLISQECPTTVLTVCTEDEEQAVGCALLRLA